MKASLTRHMIITNPSNIDTHKAIDDQLTGESFE